MQIKADGFNDESRAWIFFVINFRYFEEFEWELVHSTNVKIQAFYCVKIQLDCRLKNFTSPLFSEESSSRLPGRVRMKIFKKTKD